MVYAPHETLVRAAYDGGALADAVFHDDGERITVTWPAGRKPCVAAPEVAEGWAEQINDLRRQLREAKAAREPA